MRHSVQDSVIEETQWAIDSVSNEQETQKKWYSVSKKLSGI